MKNCKAGYNLNMYKKADTPYKKIRKRLIGANDFIGRSTGYKLKRVSYSRPATLEALKKFGSKEIRAIEIGCAAGNNSLDVLKKLNIKEYVIIDPYELIDNNFDDYSIERLKLMHSQAKKTLKKFESKITWIKKLSDDALSELHGKYDFIYIDGDHSFEFAYKDMCNYFNYLSEDFVFGGHDIDQNGVSKAFIKFTQNQNLKNIYFKDPDWIVTS